MAKVKVIVKRHPEELEAELNKFLSENSVKVIQYKTVGQFAALATLVYDVTEEGDPTKGKVKIFSGQINAILEEEMNEFLADKKFIEIQTEIINDYSVTYMITYED